MVNRQIFRGQCRWDLLAWRFCSDDGPPIRRQNKKAADRLPADLPLWLQTN